jgi:hypothetical protein
MLSTEFCGRPGAMPDFTGPMVDTPRLRQHVWTSGPGDGRPLLLVHGLPLEAPDVAAAEIERTMPDA